MSNQDLDIHTLERCILEVVKEQAKPVIHVIPFEKELGKRRRKQLISRLIAQEKIQNKEQILIDVDRAINVIEAYSLRAAHAIELRYFEHLDTQAIAIKMQMKPELVRREIAFARAMIQEEIRKPHALRRWREK